MRSLLSWLLRQSSHVASELAHCGPEAGLYEAPNLAYMALKLAYVALKLAYVAQELASEALNNRLPFCQGHQR